MSDFDAAILAHTKTFESIRAVGAKMDAQLATVKESLTLREADYQSLLSRHEMLNQQLTEREADYQAALARIGILEQQLSPKPDPQDDGQPSFDESAIPDTVKPGEVLSIPVNNIPDETPIVYHVWRIKDNGETDWSKTEHAPYPRPVVKSGLVKIAMPHILDPGWKLIQLYPPGKGVQVKKRVTYEADAPTIPPVTIPGDAPTVPSGAGVRVVHGLTGGINAGDDVLVIRDSRIQLGKGGGHIRAREVWVVDSHIEGAPFGDGRIGELTNCPFGGSGRFVLINVTTNSLHGLIHSAYMKGTFELYNVRSTNHYGDWIQGGAKVRNCAVDGLGWPKLAVNARGEQEHADVIQALGKVDVDGLTVTNYDGQIATFGHQWGSGSVLRRIKASNMRNPNGKFARNGIWFGNGDPVGGVDAGGGASNVLIEDCELDTPLVFGTGKQEYGGKGIRIVRSKFANVVPPTPGRVEVVQ